LRRVTIGRNCNLYTSTMSTIDYELTEGER
jgi:hypothetical protein